MRKLDYSHLIHNKPDVPKNHSVSHSLYIYAKKNTAGMYNETGFGDISVFTVEPLVGLRKVEAESWICHTPKKIYIGIIRFVKYANKDGGRMKENPTAVGNWSDWKPGTMEYMRRVEE